MNVLVWLLITVAAIFVSITLMGLICEGVAWLFYRWTRP